MVLSAHLITPSAHAEEAPAATQEAAPEVDINVIPDALTFDASKIVGHAAPKQLGFMEAKSPVMEELVWLHDVLLVIITVITIVVLALLTYACIRFREKRNPVPSKTTHNVLVEVLWTVVPILILVGIAIPSLRAHYFIDNETTIANPDLTVKAVGHQWYWSYEYPDAAIEFDSNIKKGDELLDGEPRLLAVDNPIVVPVGKTVRLQLTGADVIHAFAMPSFGVKMDAVPGKLNETWFKAEQEGIYYGQCSELCGKLHGFMPIQINVVSEAAYEAWLAWAKVKHAA
ncbi:MAG: cytochrome c oxidase subunit II [Alphaproteobacteria bacterium]|nr:cytochrome c oxidase subunit II [Alphaproteobacteria bacterium]